MTAEEIDLKFIKANLKRGQIKELAEDHNIPLDSAYKILSGYWNNWGFVEAAAKKAIENAQTVVALRKKINDLKTI